MSEIQRYDLKTDAIPGAMGDGPTPRVSPVQGGRYVLFTDHEKARTEDQAKIEELEAAATRADKLYRERIAESIEIRDTRLAALEAGIEELAASFRGDNDQKEFRGYQIDARLRVLLDGQEKTEGQHEEV